MSDQHVSLWHPWLDKPGQRHTLHLLSEFSEMNIDQIVSNIGGRYVYCQDIFREVERSLIRHQKSEPYLSRTGSLSALRIKSKRSNGFIIPGIQWGEQYYPTKNTLRNIQTVFDEFHYEALTPSSLSEKVLRATLPAKCLISRPSVMVRKTFLDNRRGGRILKEKRGLKAEFGYEYDENKAYLDKASKGVPTPFVSPIRTAGSRKWEQYECSWVEVTMTAHGNGIQPVQIFTPDGDVRDPMEGETFTQWLWYGEILDCIEEGYTLEESHQGYSWVSKSPFMAQWADIIFEACEKYRQDEEVYGIIKDMAVGLPGRFLKQPEIYTLLYREEVIAALKDGLLTRKDIIPICANWEDGESPMSDWFMKVDTESEKARESAQLTPIGDYIIAECRRSIYKTAKQAEREGSRVLRVYIDSTTTSKPIVSIALGKASGEYKLKIYQRVRTYSNRFLGTNEKGERILKAPSYTGQERETLLKGDDKQWEEHSFSLDSS